MNSIYSVDMNDNGVVPGMKLLSVDRSTLEGVINVTLCFQGDKGRMIIVNNFFDDHNHNQKSVEEITASLKRGIDRRVVYWEFDPSLLIASYCFDSGLYGRFGDIDSLRSLGLMR
jgi:hypothetical protein